MSEPTAECPNCDGYGYTEDWDLGYGRAEFWCARCKGTGIAAPVAPKKKRWWNRGHSHIA